MSLERFIEHFKGSQVRISKLRCTTSVHENVFILANRADTDEMQCNVESLFANAHYNHATTGLANTCR